MFRKLEGRTVLEWCEKRSCFSLSACHLKVSQSCASYHTSFQRADSGPYAELKILNFFQQITIIQAWFCGVPGSTDSPLHFGLYLCNQLEQIRLPYGNWKGTSIAFIWGIKGWSNPTGYIEKSPLCLYPFFPSYPTCFIWATAVFPILYEGVGNI